MHGSFEKTAVSRFVTQFKLAKIADAPFSEAMRPLNLLDLATANASLIAESNLSAAWGPSVGDDVPSIGIYR